MQRQLLNEIKRLNDLLGLLNGLDGKRFGL
jgi:hypothetical protein